eukprot:UN09781
MPNHGTGSISKNTLSFLHLEGLGFISVAATTALFLLMQPLVDGSPGLKIVYR